MSTTERVGQLLFRHGDLYLYFESMGAVQCPVCHVTLSGGQLNSAMEAHAEAHFSKGEGHVSEKEKVGGSA